MRRWLPPLALLAVVSMTATAACTRGADVPNDALEGGSAAARGGALSPSIETSLAAFRADLAESRALIGGAEDRDTLVGRFMAALAAHDTVALRGMAISRAEFAFLTYPHSAIARAPYELDPLTTWFLAQEASEKGISRALRHWGGRHLGYLEHACPRLEVEGPVTVHGNCIVRWTTADDGAITGDDTIAGSLFRAIVEHQGRYKFLTYANDL